MNAATGPALDARVLRVCVMSSVINICHNVTQCHETKILTFKLQLAHMLSQIDGCIKKSHQYHHVLKLTE